MNENILLKEKNDKCIKEVELFKRKYDYDIKKLKDDMEKKLEKKRNKKYNLKKEIEELKNTIKVNERGESLKLEQTYNIIQQRHNNQIDKLQKQKIDNELKECTFNPNNKIINPSKSIEISNRLYNVCKKKKKKKMKKKSKMRYLIQFLWKSKIKKTKILYIMKIN